MKTDIKFITETDRGVTMDQLKSDLASELRYLADLIESDKKNFHTKLSSPLQPGETTRYIYIE